METSVVVGLRRGFEHTRWCRASSQEFGVTVIPFGALHWAEATRAYARYGKGRHPAKLNFGDCLSYAAAKLAAQPLLFVGEDFLETDLELVEVADE